MSTLACNNVAYAYEKDNGIFNKIFHFALKVGKCMRF